MKIFSSLDIKSSEKEETWRISFDPDFPETREGSILIDSLYDVSKDFELDLAREFININADREFTKKERKQLDDILKYALKNKDVKVDKAIF